MEQEKSLCRLYHGLLMAGLAPAFVAALFTHNAGMGLVVFICAFMVALAHATALGLPIYLWQRQRRKVLWQHGALSGLIIGAVPASLLILFNMRGDWWQAAQFVGSAGMLGAIGGLAAWYAWEGPGRNCKLFRTGLPAS